MLAKLLSGLPAVGDVPFLARMAIDFYDLKWALFSSSLASGKQHYLLKVVCGLAKPNYKSNIEDPMRFGEDAFFVGSAKNADVLGVADGVGGWANSGIDPGVFSSELMRLCAKHIQEADFNPENPRQLLSKSYQALLRDSLHAYGSSTACLLALNREDGTLHSANLGDSGFMVVRDGKTLYRSRELTHAFNTPYQLALAPNKEMGSIGDRPEQADTKSIKLQCNDIVLVATDGLFDNMYEEDIVSRLESAHNVSDHEELERTARALMKEARQLSLDGSYMSPFAVNARRVHRGVRGGKPDDITILLAKVAERDPSQ